MSSSGGDTSLNDQFLTTLADELTETPVSELLDGRSSEEAHGLFARLSMSSKEEAGRRWLLTFETPGGDGRLCGFTVLLGPRNTRMESPRDGAVWYLTVKGLNDFGAIVDRGDGINCVLHITDMAWSNIEHPAEVIKPGDKIDMRILYIRKERFPPQACPPMRSDRLKKLYIKKERLKRLPPQAGAPVGSDRPENIFFEREFAVERGALMEKLQEGAVVRGTVKNLTDYGAFVDLGGIDGLLHITDMAWKRVRHPSEVVKVGDEIDVRILSLDRERSRVSLGLKQLGPDPWENIARRYPPHTRVFGKVTSIADYGAIVEIEDGVEGLVHVSEMDWTNKNVDLAQVVHTGQEVEVMVLDVDEERRRISLGLKQCQQVEPRTGR